MSATDKELIKICQYFDICYTDEDGFNRPLAVINVFEVLTNGTLTDD